MKTKLLKRVREIVCARKEFKSDYTYQVVAKNGHEQPEILRREILPTSIGYVLREEKIKYARKLFGAQNIQYDEEEA